MTVFKTDAVRWAMPVPVLPYTQPGGFAGPAQSVLGVCVVVFVVWGVASALVVLAVAASSAAMQSAPARCRMCFRVVVAMVFSLGLGWIAPCLVVWYFSLVLWPGHCQSVCFPWSTVWG
ncbi:hypothetical protein ACH4VM_35015 [Streptomyces sp. NPDC020792]|uniref:hypothetical protein n=1 Tax=Streptomyces sp. NPDC020792 TaxID=3365089 RepID=UPI0037BB5120